MVGVLTIVMVGVCSLAVDIGYQRVAARDMQAVADIVAMDMARGLQGRTTSELNGTTGWNNAVAASLARNSDSTVGEPLSVVTCDVDQTTLSGAQICATPGVYNAIDGSFTGSGDTAATHVRVISRTRVDYFFPLYSDGGWVTKTAYAESQGGACFSIGSYAAALDSGASPILGPLLGALGSNVDLTAANYDGLASADVGLANFLGANLGVGTMEELIRGDELISLGDFYLLTASALRAESGATAEVLLLEGLAAQVPGIQIPPSELLALGAGGAAGLDSELNVLDLVTAAAALANKQAGVSLPGLTVNLPPLANVTASVNVIEPPRSYCGRTNQEVGDDLPHSSAVRVSLSTALADVDIPGLLRTQVQLSGTINAASAKGELKDISCRPDSVTVGVSDGLLDVDLTLQVTVSARVLGITIPVVGGPIRITGQSTSNGDAHIILDDDDSYDVPVRVPNSSSGLPALTVNTSEVGLIGLPVGIVLSPILNALTAGLVNPLVNGLDSVLLTPLLSSLGLDLSGADVFVHRYPKCDGTALRG